MMAEKCPRPENKAANPKTTEATIPKPKRIAQQVYKEFK